MKTAVFGATGFIGKRLVETLKTKGHTVVELDVRKSGWASHMKDCDGVVNLGGYPLFKTRWNERIKAEIYDSRIESTRKIVAAFPGTAVKVFVSGSAIGIYGEGERECDENSSLSDDFLARVCKDWEEEARTAQRKHGIRTVFLRTGIVLGKDGGALQKMLLPYKLGAGGTIGLTGSQSMSWIHLDDEVGLILHALEQAKVQGPLNATAPGIVSNKVFAKALGKVLHRPAVAPLPKFMLYAMVGEAAGVVAAGQRVHPFVAEQTGYKFLFPQLEDALNNIFGK